MLKVAVIVRVLHLEKTMRQNKNKWPWPCTQKRHKCEYHYPSSSVQSFPRSTPYPNKGPWRDYLLDFQALNLENRNKNFARIQSDKATPKRRQQTERSFLRMDQLKRTFDSKVKNFTYDRNEADWSKNVQQKINMHVFKTWIKCPKCENTKAGPYHQGLIGIRYIGQIR